MKTFCVILAVVSVASSCDLGRTDSDSNGAVNKDWITDVENANEQVCTGLEQINIIQEIILSLLSNQTTNLGELEQQLILANGDINVVVQIINQALSVEVFWVDTTDNTIKINAKGLQIILVNTAKVIIKQTVKSRWQRLILTAKVTKEICSTVNELKPLLETGGCPINTIKVIVDAHIASGRGSPSTGNIVVGIVEDLVRIQLRVVLTPIRQRITVTLTELTNQILTLYIPVAPDNRIAAAIGGVVNVGVIRVAQVLVSVNYTCNVVFDNILGTKEIAVVVDGREITAQELERQVKIVTIITKPLNKLVKEIVKKSIESKYEAAGKIVLTPIELVINWLIDQLLPPGK